MSTNSFDKNPFFKIAHELCSNSTENASHVFKSLFTSEDLSFTARIVTTCFGLDPDRTINFLKELPVHMICPILLNTNPVTASKIFIKLKRAVKASPVIFDLYNFMFDKNNNSLEKASKIAEQLLLDNTRDFIVLYSKLNSTNQRLLLNCIDQDIASQMIMKLDRKFLNRLIESLYLKETIQEISTEIS